MSVHHHTLDVRHTIEHHHILFLLLALLLIAAVVVLLVPASGSIRLTPSAPAANLAAASRRGLISGVASGLSARRPP